MSLTVSLIIVNYNGARWLPACLDSIHRQSRLPDEVLLVDNSSRDESLQLVRSAYPEVRILALQENAGYAGGANRGIRSSRGELVGILNNDIVLDKDWLIRLLEHCASPWDFWASQIRFARRPDLIDSAGDAMAVVGAAYKIGHGEPAAGYQTDREVFGPCGAAALYHRSLLEATQGFDEDFFLVYEDADLSMRARLLGFRCLYVAEARVLHHVNTSIGSFTPHYVYYGHRNSEWLFWKNMPTSLLIRYLPERKLFNLLAFLYFTLRGRAGSFLRAKFDAFRHFRPLLAKRRVVQAGRRLSDQQIRQWLDRNWLRHRFKGKPLT